MSAAATEQARRESSVRFQDPEDEGALVVGVLGSGQGWRWLVR